MRELNGALVSFFLIFLELSFPVISLGNPFHYDEPISIRNPERLMNSKLSKLKEELAQCSPPNCDRDYFTRRNYFTYQEPKSNKLINFQDNYKLSQKINDVQEQLLRNQIESAKNRGKVLIYPNKDELMPEFNFPPEIIPFSHVNYPNLTFKPRFLSFSNV